MNKRTTNRIVILGGTRGLGAALCELLKVQDAHLLVVGRKVNLLEKWQSPRFEIQQTDLADVQQVRDLGEILCKWKPSHVFYVAGGGPWGNFKDPSWSSHLWALQLNLLSPMQLLQMLLAHSSLQQWVSVGSAIAESQPDPRASSYAAAKHGLKGFISTIQRERVVNVVGEPVDIRLYSPGYIDTDLIPQKFKDVLRQKGKLLEASVVANDLLAWSKGSSGFSEHRIFQ